MMGSRTRSWLLVLSLGLNLFLVGLMAGHRFSPPPVPEALPGTVFADLRRMADVLPAETVGEIRQQFESHRLEIIRGLMAMRAARDEVREVLRQDPYDPEALRAAFQGLRDRTADVQSVVHGVLVDVAGLLDPEERLAIVRTPERRGGPERRGLQDSPGRSGLPFPRDLEPPAQ